MEGILESALQTAARKTESGILQRPHHMLRDGTFYQDPGASHFHRESAEDRAERLARQIAALGFACVLTPVTGETVSV